MAVILVVETDVSYARRISEAMRSAGLAVEIRESVESAARRAAVDPPRLVIASSAVPDVRLFLERFARGRGGPGAIVMIPTTLVGQVSEKDYHADAILPRPFTGDEVRQVVLPLLSPGAAPASLSTDELFGNVLAEVAMLDEGEAPPESEGEVTPKKWRVRDSDDIDRKLEETLSGVLPRAGARRRPRTTDDDAREIDALLDKTLSSLKLPQRKRSKAPEPPPAAAPPAAGEAVPLLFAEPPPGAGAAEPPIFEPPPPLEIPAPLEETFEPAEAPVPEPLEEELPSFEPSPAEVPPPEPPEEELPSFEELTDESSASEPLADLPDSKPPPPAALSDAASPVDFDQFRTQQLTVVPFPESTEDETFGDYTLIERIAMGGMAEVWKARRRGVEGFQKTVAIKKILAHLTGSPDFVTMLIDEAKLAAQLNHNNIIQIYDLGKVDEDFFIAMEYVDGMDLRTILTTARKKHRPLPTSLALMIASSVARALDYAHRKRDFENRALGLVHRDVSPQNVLISYEGEIKLCDFGIVKAVAKASTTQMGALKGKLQYMSPEQAWGRSVDARSDIFSLGSVLFEMLTGTRLFSGDSELGVLDAVRECRVCGPRELVPEIPEEVDRVVRRALAKTPEERYQAAGEMEDELKGVVFALKPMPSQSVLASYMQELARAPEVDDAEPVATAIAENWTPPPEPGTRDSGPAFGPVSGRESRSAIEEEPALEPPAAAPVMASVVPAPNALDAPALPEASAAGPAASAPAAGSPAKKLLIAALLAAVLGAILFFVLRPWGAKDNVEGPAAPPVAAPAPPLEATPIADEAPAAVPTQGGAAAQGDEPAADGGAEDAGALDIQDLVDQEMARRAQELRREFEAQKKKLERELEEARKAAEEPPPETTEGGGGAAAGSEGR